MRFASLNRMVLSEFSFRGIEDEHTWIILICFQSTKKRKNKICLSACTPAAA